MDWDQYTPIHQGVALRHLAGFVSRAAVDLIGQSGLGVAEVGDGRGGRAGTVARLFDLLVARRVGYRLEDLDEWGSQVIRPWPRIDRVGGTCLDLALLACTQLRHAQLRPYLALHYSDKGAHATVLVDLDRVYDSDGSAWPDGTDQRPGSTRQWSAPQRPEAASRWLAYDPTQACLGHSRQFPAAVAAAWNTLATHGTTTWLVDIAAALNEDVAPRGLPAPSAPGLLSRRCPPVPDLTEFPSRTQIRAQLAEGVGTTVLAGPRGSGKSSLALQALVDLTNGAGWFLNGSSVQALRSALAEQEAFELGRSQDQTADDVDGYANNALNRLHTMVGEWAVVIDNADLEPVDIKELLPEPDPARGQHLIITTTDHNRDGSPAGWGSWTTQRDDRRLIELTELTEQESRAYLGHVTGIETIPPRARRPLALRGANRLLQNGAPPRVAASVLTSAQPEQAYWNHLRDLPGVFPPETEVLARLIAVLPQTPLPPTVLVDRPARTSGEVAEGLAVLQSWGLLTRAGGTWLMHGLHAEAIRCDVEHAAEVDEAIARLLGMEDFNQFLRTRYDVTSLEAITTAIQGGDLTPSDRGSALALLSEIHDERGTIATARDLALVALPLLPDNAHDLRAGCYLAKSRYVNQRFNELTKRLNLDSPGQLALLQVALTDAETAQHLAQDRGVYYKAVAMRGNLIQKMAPFDPWESRNQRLDEAEDLLLDALRGREKLYADDPYNLDLAKARFNMCGLAIQRGKAAGDAGSARHHFEAALRQYQLVADARRHVFGDDPHKHIASCTAGVATAYLYLALYCAATPEEAEKSLRDATREIMRSLHDRNFVERGTDGEESTKSLRLLAKIALARYALASRHENDLWARPGGVIPEIRAELRGLIDRGLLETSGDS